LYLGGPLGTSPLAAAPGGGSTSLVLPPRPRPEGSAHRPAKEGAIVVMAEEEEDEGLARTEEEAAGVPASHSSVIIGALAIQSEALKTVMENLPDKKREKEKKKAKDRMSLADSSDSSSSDGAETKMKGTKSQVAMLAFRSSKRPRRVRRFVRTLLRNMGTALHEVDIRPGMIERYFKERMCLTGHKTLALNLWLKISPADNVLRSILILEKRPKPSKPPSEEEEEGEYRLYLALAELLCAIGGTEQAVRDNGRWVTGWHLTLAAEIPWAYVNRAPATITEEEPNVTPIFTDAMIAGVHSWRKEMRSGEEEQKEPRQKRGQTDAKAKAKAKAEAKAKAKAS
jgi:hypothetical protein